MTHVYQLRHDSAASRSESRGQGWGALQTTIRSTRSAWRIPMRIAVQPPQSWPMTCVRSSPRASRSATWSAANVSPS
jgi:hypothetical protein